MSIQVGHKAPDFSLFSSAKEKVSLSQFAGEKNVLILFFSAGIYWGLHQRIMFRSR